MRLLLLPLFFAACGGPDTSIGKTTVDKDSDGYASDVDCDDAHASVNPDAPEVCDGLDNDCDESVDEDATDAPTWYADLDADTYGDPAAPTAACDAPANTVADATDCDDTHDTAFPGNPEVCDGLDNDCDGLVDDSAGDVQDWYQDADDDGYGDSAVAETACDAPPGFVDDATDCDDTRADIHPDAPETDCSDNTDYNCDGSVAYTDADGDGYPACEDCDDADDARNPGAQEVCDDGDVDEDCDRTADDDDTSTVGQPTWYRDLDEDGYATGSGTTLVQCEQPVGYAATTGDCDDYASDVNPGASEVCDPYDTDEDCDGLVDDADPSTDSASWTTWYADRDSDAYGDATRTVRQCAAPSGYVANDDDCDDADDARNPGEAEVCDTTDTDEDCDGLVNDADPDLSGGTIWYPDADGDGYGAGAGVSACSAPAGYVTNTTDCDDAHAAVHPGATEVCDSANLDEDCDGLADDADSVVTGRTTWYTDADGDGYGGANTTTACDPPAGTLATSTDCDDGAAAVHPGAAEVCDAANVDEDCDGLVNDADGGVTGGTVWYRDGDGDGYGGTTTTTACTRPSGYVATSTDCNDASASINPAAAEVCDSANTDEDCDGLADDADSAASGKTTLYRDADGDTYGNASVTTSACDSVAGYVGNGLDCDDTTASVGSDRTWYRDADGDLYGSSTTASSCTQPVGYVAASGDCNDAASAINPGATEVCDVANLDEDCDGLADDGDPSAYGRTSWYRDADADAYGTSTLTTTACDTPLGYVALVGDCNDTTASVSPAAAEVCDAGNTDEDCDGSADDADASASGKSTWYRDADSDAYGTSSTTTSACDLPAGYVATTGDCNDANAAISPGDPEICDAANTDEDCDGLADDTDPSASGKSTWYRDADADAYGSSSTTASACDLPVGYLATSGDCNDANAAIHPGATEVCDVSNADEDCDGLADDADSSVSAATKSTWYPDADGDGYGASSLSTAACDLPAGYLSTSTDCDDAHADAHPGGTEVCGDGIDQDCSGADTACVSTDFTGDYAVNTGYDAKIYGTTASDYFGYALTAGDFNGDGLGDLVVDAINGDGSSSYVDYGVVYGYYGPFATGVSTALDHDAFGVYNASTTSKGAFGQYLSNLGDIDADGRDDLLVARYAGGGYVLLGGDSTFSTSTAMYDLAVNCSAGAPGGDESASSGQDEWLCGSYSYSTYSGAVYVETGTGPTTLATITGETTYDYAGWSVAGGEDINGDGLDDMIVGAYGDDDGGSQAGAVYIVYAPVTGTFNLAGADAKLRGSAADDMLGDVVLAPGDWNGDGYPDVVAGARFYDGSSGTNTGAAFVFTTFPAGTSAATSTATAIFSGEDPADSVGRAMATGDLDGDGFPDLLVGGQLNDDSASNAGCVWLTYGPTSGTMTLGSSNAAWLGTSASDSLGISVAVVPDTDGDGKDEVAMGAYLGDERGYVDHGAVYLFNGQ